jgi:hypothetical protein
MELAGGADEPDAALADAPLPALCRYIVERFHVPLGEELPRLGRMAARVLEVHGRAHPEVVPELVRLFTCFRPALEEHHRRLVDGLVVLGLLPALAGFRFFPHYFVPAVFALALGAAPAVARWWERPRERAFRVFLAATLVLALGFAGTNAWLYLGDSRVYRESLPVYREVAERLAADECFPGSRLFVWGWAPAFYYEAGRRGARPASRFAVLAAAGLTGYVPGNPDGARRRDPGEPVQAPAHWDWLMADLERSRATYVLDTAPAGLYRWNRYPLRDYPPLDRYVAEEYEPLDEVSRVRIYRRRDCAAR